MSGSMSGEGKPPAASRSRSSALPRLYASQPHLSSIGAISRVQVEFWRLRWSWHTGLRGSRLQGNAAQGRNSPFCDLGIKYVRKVTCDATGEYERENMYPNGREQWDWEETALGLA